MPGEDVLGELFHGLVVSEEEFVEVWVFDGSSLVVWLEGWWVVLW